MRRSLIAIAVLMGLSTVLVATGYALVVDRSDDGAAASVDSPVVQQSTEPVVAEVVEESPAVQADPSAITDVSFSSGKKYDYKKSNYDAGLDHGAYCPFKGGDEF